MSDDNKSETRHGCTQFARQIRHLVKYRVQSDLTDAVREDRPNRLSINPRGKLALAKPKVRMLSFPSKG